MASMQPLTRPLRVGTDCSGMEAPLQALDCLGVEYQHVFSCDIDKNAKKTIEANFPAQVWYDDLTKRDNKEAPKVDLYVAGFPCQPFSACGKMQGFKDMRGRGMIFFEICDYLEEQRPRVFILENVLAILRHEGGRSWSMIMDALNSLGGGAYDVTWEKMNTKEHGVAQNRCRVYIVGILKKCRSGKFTFPPKLPIPSIEAFLEPQRRKATKDDLPPASSGTAHRNVKLHTAALEKRGCTPFKDAYIIDIDSSTHRSCWNLDLTPCLTHRRSGGHWISNRGRRFTVHEMMRLQGMVPKNFKQVITDLQLGAQIGNSMSVNVLERIFVRLLPCAGLVPKGTVLKDCWQGAVQRAGGIAAVPVERRAPGAPGVGGAATKALAAVRRRCAAAKKNESEKQTKLNLKALSISGKLEGALGKKQNPDIGWAGCFGPATKRALFEGREPEAKRAKVA
eukprot:TRINITY_DN4481_c0_g1_i2.p1 TRINITY_DN4481_c0_g1~~TRINITY_DN4481_c0_g1_i2.p1  ORF type:complete len:462 (+),score=82.27 TRINITY_DN4481_c0_g1_i2:36-1388(+)